jgi:small subunit ribosomal protein S13
MARIAGVDLPPNKRVEIALTYIYGIGRTQANNILNAAGVDLNTKVRELNDDETNKIRKIIEEQHRVEGDLRKEVSFNIKRLMEVRTV